ncbi:MAG: hypothetical protein Q7Q71_02020 [Verrucomicrobiota bacterium JB023]|nr:hypothetical protein [Verrucomicrobiota bacterium JB023]
MAVCSTCGHRYEVSRPTVGHGHPAPREHQLVRRATRTSVERDFALKRRAVNGSEFAKIEAPEQPKVATETPDDEGEAPPKKRRRKLKKRKSTLLRDLGIAGASALALSVAIGLYLNLKSHFSAKGVQGVAIEDKLEGMERAFYLEEYQRVRTVLRSFLATQADSGRGLYVLNTGRVPGILGAYYAQHTGQRLVKDLLPRPQFWNLVHAEEPPFVEIVWRDELANEYEAVTLKTEDGWLLDWEHFVRYSTPDWTFFRSQLGREKEGEFRLYAEEFVETDDEDRMIRVRFYPPTLDEKMREVEVSPVIEVPLDSDEGITLRNLFSDDESVQEDGGSLLATRDPEGLRRVRVVLAWESVNRGGEREMVLKEILAPHWRSDYARFRRQGENNSNQTDQ